MKKIILLFIIAFNIVANNFDYSFDYVLETPRVAGKLLSSPLEWEKKEWATLGIISASTILAFTLDEEVRELAQKNQNNTLDKLFSSTRLVGEGLPTALFFTYGLVFQDQKAFNTGWMTLESMGAAIGVSFILKYTFTRSRPFTENGSDDWFHGHGKYRDFRSFPSAHSASAFAVASVISSQYSDYKWVAPVSYTLASLTALSRIYDDQHWFSDVILGSSIGYFTGKFIYNYRKDQDLVVLPIFDNESYGISFVGKI